MLNSLPGDDARKNMSMLSKHKSAPKKPTNGITNTYVIDSKGKKPAYDSKTSMGNGWDTIEEFEFVLFI